MNLPRSQGEEKMIKDSTARNRPLGSDPWVQRLAKQLRLHQALRPRGRPLGW
jgi:hypothetical protein